MTLHKWWDNAAVTYIFDLDAHSCEAQVQAHLSIQKAVKKINSHTVLKHTLLLLKKCFQGCMHEYKNPLSTNWQDTAYITL